jgi:hypothetical protein
VPIHHRGAALGLRQTLLRLGNVGSPVILSPVATLWGVSGTLEVTARTLLVGSLIGIHAVRREPLQWTGGTG